LEESFEECDSLKKCYMVYSYDDDSTTFDPEGNQYENLIILGKSFGANPEDALKNLLIENEWIKESKFNDVAIVEINEETTRTTLDEFYEELEGISS